MGAIHHHQRQLSAEDELGAKCIAGQGSVGCRGGGGVVWCRVRGEGRDGLRSFPPEVGLGRFS